MSSNPGLGTQTISPMKIKVLDMYRNPLLVMQLDRITEFSSWSTPKKGTTKERASGLSIHLAQSLAIWLGRENGRIIGVVKDDRVS
jgi:hypothetical protein